LVRWSSLLWLVFSALIGQMAQSAAVIGLLCFDWSDGPVCCCDWSSLLWLVRWSTLLRWVYSTLIGQMAKSVVIGLPLTAHVGNKTPITISEFKLRGLPQCLIYSDTNGNNGISFFFPVSISSNLCSYAY